MSKIIIGIHGMGNKPERSQLESWWKAAIREGLEGRGPAWFLKFKMVYWASVLYERPLHFSDAGEKDSLFLKEPYVSGLGVYETARENKLKHRLRDRLNDQLDGIFLDADGALHFNRLTDFILSHFVKDLNAYYNDFPAFDQSRSTRDMICERLAETLYKNRRKKILLIAHSMGSIIAWDVLSQYVPQVRIHTLVTIGSPLGLPVVRAKLLHQKTGDTRVLNTPENITKAWFNLADFKDKVAFRNNLENDFLPNSSHVYPVDIPIHNNYIYKGEANPHKSYGYLRCPETADIIRRFRKPALLHYLGKL